MLNGSKGARRHARRLPCCEVAPLLYGLGDGVAFPALTVLVGEAAPAQQRGRAVALSASCSFAGQFLSPLLLGPLMGATSITTRYLAAAGLATVALTGVVIWRGRLTRYDEPVGTA